MKKLILVALFIFAGSMLFGGDPKRGPQGKPSVQRVENKGKPDKAKGKKESEKPKGKKYDKSSERNHENGDDDELPEFEEDKGMKAKGLEKQREKKANQIQKESGKGSEKGQEARSKRKKWWKF